jgi:hypothetical protein
MKKLEVGMMAGVYQEISPILNKEAFEEFKNDFIGIEEEEISQNFSNHKKVLLRINDKHSIQVELSVGKITKNEQEVFLSVQFVEDFIISAVGDIALFVMYSKEIMKIKDVIEAIAEEISLKLKQLQADVEFQCHFQEKLDKIQNMTEEEKESVLECYKAIF